MAQRLAHQCWSQDPMPLYRVSQKKRNGRFSVPCELKVWYIFTSLDEASSQKRMIPKSLNLVEQFWFYANFLKYSHCQISLEFCDRWAKNCERKSLPYGVLWKPIDPCFCCCHGSTGFHKTPYGSLVLTQFFTHRSQKSSEIWKWLYFKKWA